jgi:hypothetical protein
VVGMTAGYIASELDPGSKHMYRMWGIPADYYPPLYAWLKENFKERRVAIMNPDDESARAMSALGEKLLKDGGYTVTSNDLYEKSLRDFLPLLTKVLANKPDLIDLGATAPATAAVMIRQAREFGYKGVFFIPGSSAWREILSYFGAATQIGMTATPKETADVSNIDYFGEPVYSYSLRQGIEDGFLAPYRVHRVITTVDAAGWRPSKDELDRFGREVPDDEYETKDFERVVALRSRTKAMARHLTDFLKGTDRFAKTLIFCVDQEHAAEMRQ